MFKEKLVNAPLLAYPDFSIPFVVEVDASVDGLGAILRLKQYGKSVVIAYASSHLKQHERSMKNFSSMKIELLAMSWAITKRIKYYLFGDHFTVLTNIIPLSHLMNIDLADFSDFDFSIQYNKYY